MSSKNFFFYFLCLSFLACNGDGASSNHEGLRPNLITILVDDMGFSDLGCYGAEINTPNIDRLASNGIRFNQFYNASKCCPTRASLLTGLYQHEAGMGAMITPFGKLPTHPGEGEGPYQGYLNDECVTLAEVLKTAGYDTYMAGKWHVGENPIHWPMKRGFDRYFGLISGASSYYEVLTKQERVRMMVKEDSPWTPPAEGFYMTDAFTDYAIERVDEHKAMQDEDPFFLHLCYNAPHWPLHAPEEDIAKYKGKYSAGWDAVRTARYEKQKELGIIDDRYQLAARTKRFPTWEEVEDKATWERKMEVYAAMIDRVDQNVGRLLEKLESNGQLENTLILFLSDNGASPENISGRELNNPEVPIGAKGSYVAYREPWAMVSNTPFQWYKGNEAQGGIATPFIAHWPKGIAAKGAITQQAAHIIDIMPTFVKLADADYPTEVAGQKIKPMRGQSLLPFFSNLESQEPRELFFEFNKNKAVIKGDWKLTNHPLSKEWKLYNLKEDPTEQNNRMKEDTQKFLELRKLYGEWSDQVGVNYQVLQ